MLKRRLAIAATLVSLLPACITPSAIDGRLRTWLGHDADDLAKVWGAPNGSYQLKDGSRILTYESTSVVTTGTQVFPEAKSRFCRVDFTVDAQNKIRELAWKGVAEQCNQIVVPDPATGDPDDL